MGVGGEEHMSTRRLSGPCSTLKFGSVSIVSARNKRPSVTLSQLSAGELIAHGLIAGSAGGPARPRLVASRDGPVHLMVC